MSLFKNMLSAAGTGMLPMLLSPVIGRDNADKIAPHLKNAISTVNQKNLNDNNSSMKDLLKVIKETGMTRQQLLSSLNYLGNSKIGQTLNYFSPNLVESLRGIGQEAYRSMGDDRPSSVVPTQSGGITSKYPSYKK